MKKIIASFLTLAFVFANSSCATLAISTTNTETTKVLSTKSEHLKQSFSVKRKTPTDVVVITPTFSRVVEFNIVEITFAQDFSGKTAQAGDSVVFLLNDGLKTKEGTLVVPAGSVISAKVKEVIAPKRLNKSGKVYLVFDEITLPNGQKTSFNAKVFNKKDDALYRGKLSAFGKGVGTTLGTMGVATGVGCGIGVAAGAVAIGGLAIGMPVGFVAGAIIGFATPGLHYKAKAGEKLLVQLTDNLEVQK